MKKTLSFIAAACLFCCCLCGAALAETQDVYEELDGILDTISGLDGDVSTEQTARIIAQLEDLDFSKAEESGGLTGSMVGDSGMSLQQYFAMLQLQLAQEARESAQAAMEQIQAKQELLSTCSQYVSEAVNIWSDLSEAGDTAAVPADMLAFLQEHSLYVPTDPDKADYESWKAVVIALESFQESISSGTQQQMVFIQDYIGQYNSYTQGTSSAISDMNEVLKGLASSGTMLGGGAGMTITALILGLVLGAAATALVLKKKTKA